MSIRIILTPVFGRDVDATSLAVGVDLGNRFGARVDVLFARVDPFEAVPVIGEGVSPAVIDQLTEAAAAEMDRRRDAASASFDSAIAAAGVVRADQPVAPSGVSARFRELTGRRSELIAREAMTSDLVILGRGNAATADEMAPIIEATLLGSGRPLVVLPPDASPGIGRNVAVAWNGRAEATRALAGALPLVERAETVSVLTAETLRTDFDATLALVEYLESHGVAATRQPVDASGQSVGEALLDAAKVAGADLLVMGGYGRTRFSELVLGGVTRHVLAHAELAVLMAH